MLFIGQMYNLESLIKTRGVVSEQLHASSTNYSFETFIINIKKGIIFIYTTFIILYTKYIIHHFILKTVNHL